MIIDCIYGSNSTTEYAHPLIGDVLSNFEWDHSYSSISTVIGSYGLDTSMVHNPSFFELKPSPVQGSLAHKRQYGLLKPDLFKCWFLFKPLNFGDVIFDVCTYNLMQNRYTLFGTVLCNTQINPVKSRSTETVISAKSTLLDLAELTHLNDGWELLEIQLYTAKKNIEDGISFTFSFTTSVIFCISESINTIHLKAVYGQGSSASRNQSIYNAPPNATYVSPALLYGSQPKDVDEVPSAQKKIESNQGRQTCFKCGGLTKKVDSGMFSVWDICPKCGV